MLTNALSFRWADRYGRGLIDLGPPPAEFDARKKYDVEMERLLDYAIEKSIRDCRRHKRYAMFRGWMNKLGWPLP